MQCQYFAGHRRPNGSIVAHSNQIIEGLWFLMQYIYIIVRNKADLIKVKHSKDNCINWNASINLSLGYNFILILIRDIDATHTTYILYTYFSCSHETYLYIFVLHSQRGVNLWKLCRAKVSYVACYIFF